MPRAKRKRAASVVSGSTSANANANNVDENEAASKTQSLDGVCYFIVSPDPFKIPGWEIPSVNGSTDIVFFVKFGDGEPKAYYRCNPNYRSSTNYHAPIGKLSTPLPLSDHVGKRDPGKFLELIYLVTEDGIASRSPTEWHTLRLKDRDDRQELVGILCSLLRRFPRYSWWQPKGPDEEDTPDEDRFYSMTLRGWSNVTARHQLSTSQREAASSLRKRRTERYQTKNDQKTWDSYPPPATMLDFADTAWENSVIWQTWGTNFPGDDGFTGWRANDVAWYKTDTGWQPTDPDLTADNEAWDSWADRTKWFAMAGAIGEIIT